MQNVKLIMDKLRDHFVLTCVYIPNGSTEYVNEA